MSKEQQANFRIYPPRTKEWMCSCCGKWNRLHHFKAKGLKSPRRVPDKYRSVLEKVVGIRHIATSPPYFVPTAIKSSVERTAMLNNQKVIPKEQQTKNVEVCLPHNFPSKIQKPFHEMRNATRARRLYRTMWTILEEICNSFGVSLNDLVQFHFQNQQEDFNALIHILIPDGLLHLPMIRTRYLDRTPRQRQTILIQCASIIQTVLSHFSGPGQTVDSQFVADLLPSPLMTEMLRGDASTMSSTKMMAR